MPSARGSMRRYSKSLVRPAVTVWLAPIISDPRGGSQCSRKSRLLTEPLQHPSSHANWLRGSPGAFAGGAVLAGAADAGPGGGETGAAAGGEAGVTGVFVEGSVEGVA